MTVSNMLKNNSTATNLNTVGNLAWMTSLHQIMEYSAETIALVTNTILVYLILTEKKQAYKDYKRVLLLNCLIDYTCTFVIILLQPHYEFLDGQWIYILRAPLIYFPRPFQIVICGCYAFSNSFGITTIPIQFLFRKRLICEGEKMSIYELMKWTGISFSISSLCALVFFLSFYVSKNTPFSSEALIQTGMVYQNDAKNLVNAEMITVPFITITAMASFLDTITLILVLYFSFQIYKKLSVLRQGMHPKTRQMQENLNRMLAVQAMSAFCVGVFPMFFLLIIMATKINIFGAGTLISIFLAFVPVVNPVCTLVLVAQFRRRFLRIARIGPSTVSSSVRPENTKETTGQNVFTTQEML